MQETKKASLSIRIVCALSILIAALGAFIGSGALGGTPIAEAADGRLGADATLLAPGTGAFAIWSFIYTALVVYAIWQMTPRASMSPTQTRIRPLAAASAILNALWIFTVQLGFLALSVVVIVVLLVVLIEMFRRMLSPQQSRFELWLMAITFGPYLGWVSVATIANIAAWLSSMGVGNQAAWAPALACVLVVVAALIGAMTVLFSRGRVATALAMTWGIAWIGIGRSDGGLESPAVAMTAFGAAAALLLLVVVAGVKRIAKYRMEGATL
ncbi:tryptophan-rich sensory protein [Paeniglutamicibacter sp. Y32M11]|jgi:benzodiazapine receptor|uniref:tryptophan-rich sensory protein n=1 Tax=Paeniglutamicibacter sp. Y32M11 TaxID=2853258 RepID=UPI001C52E518|nr:tryptophan-rich sensory protein [Paeniglutamicibacter sp. Y32M11]QXQ09148.1 tryptophan-rich sensory protein [Paeniglutamicibacter sp. Y32M11]